MSGVALEQVQESGLIAFCLPPLSEDDPLFAEKQRLLDVRQLQFKFVLPLHSSIEEVLQIADKLVQTARILYMNEIELYFAGDDDIGPFSPRNELESLNFILAHLSSLISNVKYSSIEVLHLVHNTIFAMIKTVGDNNIDTMTAKKFGTDSEELLLKWGQDHGLKTMLSITYFEEAGRGAVALEDMSIGDIALEIPESLIISEDLVYNSDMFDVLKKLDDITPETMLLLWSMRERFNPNSKFKIYFDTLPTEFNTGLNFRVDALAALEGTLLFEELLQSKEHLRQQFDALCPQQCDNYPDIFEPKLYTWDKFLWACELWYSNSMKVVFADGKLRTCLVPVAGFLNHSLCPHILHYGRVDPVTKTLKFPISRPCEKGNQCYLSYGSLPSSHFLMFYGFVPKGDNFYDVIPLAVSQSTFLKRAVDFFFSVKRFIWVLAAELLANVSCSLGPVDHINVSSLNTIETNFDTPDNDGHGNQPLDAANGRNTHMVRGTWLSNADKPHVYGLPPKLLAHLHAVLKSDGSGLPPFIPGEDIELYFAGDDEIGPFSPRNKLNFILAHLSSLISNVKYSSIEVLHLAHNTIFAMIKTVGDNNINTMTAKKFGTDSEELLLKWGQDHGLKTMLSITYFEEAGRGSVALEDMSIGGIALEIPEPLIISEDLVYNSGMVDAYEVKKQDLMAENSDLRAFLRSMH
ncbi:hypothetical protein ZIOFF_020894 [Zingiber officinale]|uniref:Rubisco LSMT substrate-binding domain-containing protein n=1 Tax=Zingiber officinale TaxID=94328 RepID=A0A8J5LG38_ZINOF|nr:hypothetical protein ZIOFF_020894 [Zingiber officinale]